jgi:Protein of unknown function (DUF4199)
MISKVLETENIRLALKWSVIYTGMTIAWAVLGKALGLHDTRIQYNLFFNSAVLIPSLPVYVLAIREMSASSSMKYGERLLCGLLLTAFVTVLGPLNPVISVVFISPHFFENAIRYSVESGMMTDAEAQQQFNLTTFIVQGFIGAPIFGLVLSLVAALFPRSPRAPEASAVRKGAFAK